MVTEPRYRPPPIGRIGFIVGNLIIAGMISLIPSVFRGAAPAPHRHVGGSDAAVDMMFMLFSVEGLILGAAVMIGIPVLLLAWARLRDLNLSPVLLLAFPIWPLAGQAAWAMRGLVMGRIPSTAWNADLILGAACLLYLATVPGSIARRPQGWFHKQINRLTEIQSSSTLGEFRRRIALGMVMYVISYLVGMNFLGLVSPQFIRHEGLNFITLANYVVRGLMDLSFLFMLSTVIRRLRDINQNIFLTFFFPFGLGTTIGQILSLIFEFMTTGDTRLASGYYSNYFGIAYGIYSFMTLALLIYLFVAKYNLRSDVSDERDPNLAPSQ